MITALLYGQLSEIIRVRLSKMTKETPKPAVKPDSQGATEIEHDADDVFEEGEFTALPDGIEKETIRRDARRKIEIYWEKRRLREQFDDFDDSEFGF
jgi:hypothetical protein